jgi:hypothetical protein
MKKCVCAWVILCFGASPALAQSADTAAHLKLAEEAWASSAEQAGLGGVAFWHAFDWSQRVFWAECDADREAALERRLKRVRQLEACLRDAAKLGRATEHDVQFVSALREQSETSADGPRPGLLRRLRRGVAGMAKALSPGDAVGLSRFESASDHLRWEEAAPPPDGAVFTFEDEDEDELSPQDARHRERMLGVLRGWLGSEGLSAEERALGVQALPERSGRGQENLAPLIVDSCLLELQRAPRLELVERLVRLTTLPPVRAERGVLSFDETPLPEWDARRWQDLERRLNSQGVIGRLPSSAVALATFRRLTAAAVARARPRKRVAPSLPVKGEVLALARRLVEEPRADARQDWVDALRALGPFAQEATGTLAGLLATLDATDAIFEDVAEALGKIVSPAAARALAAQANAPGGSLETRTVCLKALVWSGPLAEAGARAALEGDLRLPALELLGEVGFREPTACDLAAILEDANASVEERVAALDALQQNPGPGQAALAAVRHCAERAGLGREDQRAAGAALAILKRYAGP